MFSHGAPGGEGGRDEQGQASPRGVPFTEARPDEKEVGQMGARPSMRTVQSVGSGMMGTEEARVRGCERR
jgi:hypothetical protein